MKKKYFLPALVIVLLMPLISGYSKKSDELVNAQAQGELSVQTNEDAKAAQAVLAENLQRANAEDVAGYVQTLIPKARENTAKEMEKFFETYDVEHSLQSFEVLKLENGHMLAETKIKTISKDTNKKKYRDHIATANHTFIYQEGQWLIEQSVMIETDFIN